MSYNPYQKPNAKLTSKTNSPQYSKASPIMVAMVLLVATSIMLVIIYALEQAFGLVAIKGSRFLLTVLPSLGAGVFLAKWYRAMLPMPTRALGVLYFAVGYFALGTVLTLLVLKENSTLYLHMADAVYWLTIAVIWLLQLVATYAFVYMGERACF